MAQNSRHLRIVDKFYPKAKALRQIFDERFAKPREANSNRFVWDLWHVPDQYTLVRTPAYRYFEKKIYQNFENHLIEWGRKNLGCQEISPPWLSYYVNGCVQHLHADVPHGPWAWVYSLTPWQRRNFTGGETLLLKPETLSLWSHQKKSQVHELNQFVTRVPSLFNRLTLFDPRIPHGVTRVDGSMDPREGRLVMHGWFTSPTTTVSGALRLKEITKPLNDLIHDFTNQISNLSALDGFLSLKLKVSPNGKLAALDVLSDTVVDSFGNAPKGILLLIAEASRRHRFPQRASGSQIILPLTFSSR